jgi:hypothetical protein
MHNLTHQKILAMLKGCTSTAPMEFDTLVRKTGLLPDTLAMVLAQMQHSLPATINSCIITKAGKSRTVYWPTCASMVPRLAYGRTTYPAQPAAPAAPQASSPDVPRTISGKKALELITAQPGIFQNDLVNRLMRTGVSLATCYNAIRTLTRGHFITRTGKQLYPAGGEA